MRCRSSVACSAAVVSPSSRAESSSLAAEHVRVGGTAGGSLRTMSQRSKVPHVWFPTRQNVGVDRLTQLLLEAQSGDRRAFEQFIAETQADVWRMCRYLGDLSDADDLAQETYERAVGSLHRYRREGPAKAWLLTIARRVCVDHTRRQQRRRRRDSRAVDDALLGGGLGSVIAPDDAGRLTLDALVDGLDAESDDIVLMRKCLIVGKLMLTFEGAKDLIRDLGFDEVLRGVVAVTKEGPTVNIVKEILNVVDS